MSVIYQIILFLAGLGVFIKAMDMMGKSMQSLFGLTVRKKLEKLSNRPFVSALMGTGGTIALQSSTAMIVLLLSFVEIGLLTLSQSLPIVIGINVGASLIFASLLASAFNLTIIFAGITIVGVFINLLSRKTKIKAIGNIVFAFGLLFLGLYIIGLSMSFLKTLDFVNVLMTTITNPLLLILIGVCMSVLTQSSLATNAIIISLCAINGDAGLAIQSALWLSVGSRIGPTSAGIFASIGKGKTTKSVALFHLIFNLSACILFALSTLTGWTDLLISALQNPALVIVVFNIICSLGTAIVIFPLYKAFAKLLPKLIKSNNKADIYEIEEKLFLYPELCIGQFDIQFDSLFKQHIINLDNLMDFCLNPITKYANKDLENDNAIFYLNVEKVKSNILKLNLTLSEELKAKKFFYVECIGRFHSLADRIAKIINLFAEKEKDEFSEEQSTLIAKLYEKIKELSDIVYQFVHQYDDLEVNSDDATKIIQIDKEVMKLKLQLKEKIIEGYDNASQTQIFSDKISRLINQLEQLGEHYSAICFFGFESKISLHN